MGHKLKEITKLSKHHRKVVDKQRKIHQSVVRTTTVEDMLDMGPIDFEKNSAEGVDEDMQAKVNEDEVEIVPTVGDAHNEIADELHEDANLDETQAAHGEVQAISAQGTESPLEH